MSGIDLPQTFQIVVWSFIVVYGLCIGSFLNVCIYRLPRELSIVKPPSHCGNCRYHLKWYDNIPVISFILLRGQCRKCGVRFGWIHPFVELLTALVAVFLFAFYGFSWVGLIYFGFVCSLIVVSFVDLKFRIIPDEISLGGIFAGLLLSFCVPQLHGVQSHWLGLWYSFLGGLAGGAILMVTAIVGDFLFRKESMGGGDIKLLAMAGTFIGWKWAVLTFFIAPFFAIIPGFCVLLFKRSHIVPYGPFLAIAMLVSLWQGDALLHYLGIQQSFDMIFDYYGNAY